MNKRKRKIDEMKAFEYLNELTMAGFDFVRDTNPNKTGYHIDHERKTVIKCNEYGLKSPFARNHLDLLEDNLKLCVLDEVLKDVLTLKSLLHEFGHFMNYFGLPRSKAIEISKYNRHCLWLLKMDWSFNGYNTYEANRLYLTTIPNEIVAENFAYKNIKRIYQKLTTN